MLEACLDSGIDVVNDGTIVDDAVSGTRSSGGSGAVSRIRCPFHLCRSSLRIVLVIVCAFVESASSRC